MHRDGLMEGETLKEGQNVPELATAVTFFSWVEEKNDIKTKL